MMIILSQHKNVFSSVIFTYIHLQFDVVAAELHSQHILLTHNFTVKVKEYL